MRWWALQMQSGLITPKPPQPHFLTHFQRYSNINLTGTFSSKINSWSSLKHKPSNIFIIYLQMHAFSSNRTIRSLNGCPTMRIRNCHCGRTTPKSNPLHSFLQTGIHNTLGPIRPGLINHPHILPTPHLPLHLLPNPHNRLQPRTLLRRRNPRHKSHPQRRHRGRIHQPNCQISCMIPRCHTSQHG